MYLCCQPDVLPIPWDHCALCAREPGTPNMYRFPVPYITVCTHSGCGRGEGLKQGKHLSENVQSLLSPFLPSFAAGLTNQKYIKVQKLLATNDSSLHRCIIKNSRPSLSSRLVLPRKSEAKSAKYTKKQHKSLSVSSPLALPTMILAVLFNTYPFLSSWELVFATLLSIFQARGRVQD